MKVAGYLLLSGLLLTSACATQSRTVQTESHETRYDDRAGRDGTVIKKSETTQSETSSTESGGVISGTVDIVGKTLALPFRFVGGLIDLVF